MKKYHLFANIANYTELCTIQVDLSHLPLSRQRRHSGKGTFYCVEYDTVLLFGLTGFKAAIAWKENVSPSLLIVHWINFYQQLCQGVERRSAARIIYDQKELPAVPSNDN